MPAASKQTSPNTSTTSSQTSILHIEAAKLDSHEAFVDLIAERLPEPGQVSRWPDNDLVGDQFRPEFNPYNGRTRSTLYTTTATKRARDFESHLNEQPSQTQSADEPTSRSKRRKIGAQSTGSGT